MGKPGQPTMLKVPESVQDRVQDRDHHPLPDHTTTTGAGGGR